MKLSHATTDRPTDQSTPKKTNSKKKALRRENPLSHGHHNGSVVAPYRDNVALHIIDADGMGGALVIMLLVSVLTFMTMTLTLIMIRMMLVMFLMIVSASTCIVIEQQGSGLKG